MLYPLSYEGAEAQPTSRGVRLLPGLNGRRHRLLSVTPPTAEPTGTLKGATSAIGLAERGAGPGDRRGRPALSR